MNPSTPHTPGKWKSELLGTNSGQWFSIYVEDDRYQDGRRELFESATVQINVARRNSLKPRWKDTEEADEIRANVSLALAAPKMLNALKAVQALLPADTQAKIETLILEAESLPDEGGL